MSMRRLAAALLVVAAVASCGGGDDEPANPEPTTTNPTTTSPSPEDDEQELRKLATDWYKTRADLGLALKPDYSVIPRYLTGVYERDYRINLMKARADGLLTRTDPQGRARHRVESVEVNGDMAVIVECIVDSNVLIRIADGSIYNDDVQTDRLRVDAKMTGDGWRLADATEVAEWEGVAGCAA